jgi:hypothetical protein
MINQSYALDSLIPLSYSIAMIFIAMAIISLIIIKRQKK